MRNKCTENGNDIASSTVSRSRRTLILGSMAAVAVPALISQKAVAQPSNKASRVIIGFAPGGNGDFLARRLVQDITSFYPAGLIVENRPGASGRIAAETLRNADPDGSSLLYAPAATFTILPHAITSGAYKPLTFLAPIAAVSKQDFAVVVNIKSPAQSVSEYLRFAKDNPALASYGTAGAGTPQHLIGCLLAKHSGVPLTHVAYRGGSVATTDLLAGHIPMAITAISEQLINFQRDRQLRILAVSGAKRSRLLADTPTLVEQGFSKITVDDWSGVLAPIKTPKSVIANISNTLAKVTSTAAYSAGLAKAGQEAISIGFAEYTSRLQEDYERWGPVVKEAGFTLDS